MTDTIRELYDRAAEVTAGPGSQDAMGPGSYDAARRLFAEHEGLRTPEVVTSFAPFNGPSEVTLRASGSSIVSA
ncbi:hypothetical protein ACGFW5_00805 [Streptomyces sp. NPDC048416]|uniref:hypothetical protein n=1 Tax=Streptomyces sp. NPDC048416 TaxID=3365546 RepID=UPI0037162329